MTAAPPLARLLLPALRADATGSFAHAEGAAREAIELGVGGFLLFGGRAADLPELAGRLRDMAGFPLLLASDLERGAGQQFAGATSLPPAAALGFLDDLEVTREAGAITGGEARAIGLDLVFAPVADLANEPGNPIVGNRAFGADPARVAEHVAAWIAGCRAAGALACAKHVPGHGRARHDSPLTAGGVVATAREMEDDLAPFEAAVDAGVDALMTAHVAYPALDPSGSVATLSTRILRDLLRDRLGFEGAVVTDALNMGGVVAGTDHPAVSALAAGCDLLLFPDDLAATVAGLAQAFEAGALDPARVREAFARRDRLIRRVAELRARSAPSPLPRAGAEEWASRVARESITPVRGRAEISRAARLVIVDDDLGGPHPPPSRTTFADTLRRREVTFADDAEPLLLVFADTRGWKGRAGLSEGARESIQGHLRENGGATVILFGDRRVADEIPDARNLLCAWGGEARMQRAAAEWLALRMGR